MLELTVTFGPIKRVAEIKPYIHAKIKCETYDMRMSTNFCPHIGCLMYFCDDCWKTKHSEPGMTGHESMQRGRYFIEKSKLNDFRGQGDVLRSIRPSSSRFNRF